MYNHKMYNHVSNVFLFLSFSFLSKEGKREERKERKQEKERGRKKEREKRTSKSNQEKRKEDLRQCCPCMNNFIYSFSLSSAFPELSFSNRTFFPFFRTSFPFLRTFFLLLAPTSSVTRIFDRKIETG